MTSKAPSLTQIQEWMQSTLFDPSGAASQQAETLVADGVHLSGADCLRIYQRSYHQRLLACMREQFPALVFVLGEQLFTDFAREYLRTYPADSYTLYDLGRRFPSYLAETRPDADAPEKWVSFVMELAEFEQIIFSLLDAPGWEGRAFPEQNVDDDNLQLQPCFKLAVFTFPVAKFYHDVKAGREPAIPAPSASHLAILRRDFMVQTMQINQVQHYFLSRLTVGAGINQALKDVSEHVGMPLAQIETAWHADDGFRRKWLEAGFFVPTAE